MANKRTTKIKNNLPLLRFANQRMTQQQLADKLGVSRNTINSIENGKYLPSLELALKIAQYFNTSVESVFFKEEQD